MTEFLIGTARLLAQVYDNLTVLTAELASCFDLSLDGRLSIAEVQCRLVGYSSGPDTRSGV
jgi:hypothetical protein